MRSLYLGYFRPKGGYKPWCLVPHVDSAQGRHRWRQGTQMAFCTTLQFINLSKYHSVSEDSEVLSKYHKIRGIEGTSFNSNSILDDILLSCCWCLSVLTAQAIALEHSARSPNLRWLQFLHVFTCFYRRKIWYLYDLNAWRLLWNRECLKSKVSERAFEILSYNHAGTECQSLR